MRQGREEHGIHRSVWRVKHRGMGVESVQERILLASERCTFFAFHQHLAITNNFLDFPARVGYLSLIDTGRN